MHKARRAFSYLEAQKGKWYPPLIRALVHLALAWLIIPGIAMAPLAQAGDDWLPIPPEELALKDNPASPGAQAILLYREMHTDDEKSYETNHYRIKILANEGKKYANVEIPYWKGRIEVVDIRARTVRPDGTAVNFNGNVFEKLVVKHKKLRILVKAFTLPDVQIGSIIEYKYKLQGKSGRLPPTRWMIDHELFTRRARFTRQPYSGMVADPVSGGPAIPYVYWTSFRLPKEKTPRKQPDGSYLLELEDIPAFQQEQFMPPEAETKMRVDFVYASRWQMPGQFWNRTGKELHEKIEKFIGKSKAIAQAASQAVRPEDTPETKLRKLYARVHQIRNLDYEPGKTRREVEREDLSENKNAEDVLKRGYGNAWPLNWLFVALARAAGFEASVVRVASRNQSFFKEDVLDAGQLNADLVLVRLGSKDIYLDPATRYCPFGLLSWDQTGVRGIRLAPDGSEFVTTPLPESAVNVIDRKATLQLAEDGSLGGSVHLAYTGQEALQRRLEALGKDDAERRKELEEEVKGWLPAGATVEQQSVTGWEASEEPLGAEFAVRIPNFGASTGRRLLLPLAIFQANEKHPFQHARRIHPVYFRYPHQYWDEIALEIPERYQIETLPAPKTSMPRFGHYEISHERQGSTLRLRRRFAMDGVYFKQEHYSSLRLFFDAVRSGDGQQVVLRITQASGQN